MTPTRLWLSERFYGSALARRAYGRIQRGRAERALGKGDVFGAARQLLHAWKHAGEETLGPRGRDLFARILRPAQDAHGGLRTVAENALRHAYVASPSAQALRAEFAGFPLADRVRLRSPKPGAPASRQGDLVVLKAHDPASGEPGVLLVTYHMGIERLPAIYDLGRLAGRYVFVLEPSTWGYPDAIFLPWLGSDLDVLVESQSPPDFAFLQSLGTNLVPSTLGAGDWADPALFAPKAGPERTYDVAMIAAWDPLKRHARLLDALARLRDRSERRLTAALVGYDWTWKRGHIERLVARRGLANQVTLFDRVPQAEVARILADSRLSVLLSRREGANRAIYESWFCGTPTLVPREHRGVNLVHASGPAGRLFDDAKLESALLDVLDHPEGLDPRGWALANTGCHVATRRLEDECRALALRRGLPWTTGLAVRHAAGYIHEADRLRLAPEYDRLAVFLLPE